MMRETTSLKKKIAVVNFCYYITTYIITYIVISNKHKVNIFLLYFYSNLKSLPNLFLTELIARHNLILVWNIWNILKYKQHGTEGESNVRHYLLKLRTWEGGVESMSKPTCQSERIAINIMSILSLYNSSTI